MRGRIRITIAIIVCFWMLSYSYMRDYYMDAPLDRNYMALKYVDNNIIFYTAGNKRFTKYPRPVESFSISPHAWLISKLKDNACRDSIDTIISFTEIEYGTPPKCFIDNDPKKKNYPAKNMIINQLYEVNHSMSLDDDSGVYFRLHYCDESERNICMKTNSRITKILEMRHRKMIEALRRYKGNK